MAELQKTVGDTFVLGSVLKVPDQDFSFKYNVDGVRHREVAHKVCQ